MSEESAIQSVGTFIRVSSTIPALTEAGFIANTGWQEVGGVESVGEIRMTRNLASRTPLKDGIERNKAGTASFEAFSVEGSMIRGDVGQDLMETHLRSGALLSFEINYSDGGKEFGVAVVTGGGRGPGDDPNGFAGMSYELKPSGATVIADPA